MYEVNYLEPAGTTGNVTGTGVNIEAYSMLAFQFVVEAVGGSPTVTWKIQATPDARNVIDSAAHWYDLGYVTDASDTISQATRVATAVGGQINFLANPLARRYRRFRVVTTLNTAVTFRVEAYRIV